ncbi:histidine phosphatase superfamily [Cunninghamella echinulata]|nr:histidine phosphatase superfamily [Cunninghamella echinulata]
MAPTPTNVFIVRHGERIDHVSSSWQPDPAHGISDPPLSSFGHQQAEKTGNYLCELIQQRNMKPSQATIMIYTSPFQRCIDTSIGIIKGMQPFINSSQPPIIRLELGLSEWMSDQFFDQVYCSGSQFLSRHQVQLAQRQAMNYKLLQQQNNDSLLPPLTIDYSYQSFTSQFNYPESYPDMLKRFNDTRLHCLKYANYQLPRNYCNVTPSSIIVIMVTHAIGVNALLDAFQNIISRPIKTNYCCVSSLEYKSIPITSSSLSSSSSSSPTSYNQQSFKNRIRMEEMEAEEEVIVEEEEEEDLLWMETSICNNYVNQQKWVLDLTASDLHLTSIST